MSVCCTKKISICVLHTTEGNNFNGLLGRREWRCRNDVAQVLRIVWRKRQEESCVQAAVLLLSSSWQRTPEEQTGSSNLTTEHLVDFTGKKVTQMAISFPALLPTHLPLLLSSGGWSFCSVPCLAASHLSCFFFIFSSLFFASVICCLPICTPSLSLSLPLTALFTLFCPFHCWV